MSLFGAKKETIKELRIKKTFGIALVIVLTLVFALLLLLEVENVSSKYELEIRKMGIKALNDAIEEEVMAVERAGREGYDIHSSLRAIEGAYNTRLIIFSDTPDESGCHSVIYSSEVLPQYGTVEEYGISEERIAKTSPDGETIQASMLTDIEFDNEVYALFLQKKPDSSLGVSVIYAYLIPLMTMGMVRIEQTAIITGAFLVIAVVMFVWIYSTFILIHDHSLNEEQRKVLGKKQMSRRVVDGAFYGGIVIFLISMLFMALSRLFAVYQQVDSSFSALAQRIRENTQREERIISLNKEAFEEYASEIAGELSDEPEKATAAYLEKKCAETGADYIMLFDENGEEYLSNSDYVGLKFGISSRSATYDFRRLLNGVPIITHDEAIDELTGESSVLIGARMGKPEATGHYKALLMAVPGEKIYIDTTKDVGAIMSSLVYEGMEAFCVDPESRIVVAASNPDIVGKNAVSLGLTEKALVSGYRDYFDFNGRNYYGECEELDGKLYYYAAEGASIGKNIFGYAVGTVITYFILIMILVVYMMYDYGKFFGEWSNVGEQLKTVNMITDETGRFKFSEDPSQRWRTDTSDYGILAPIYNARVALSTTLVVCVLIIALILSLDNSEAVSPLMTYVLTGTWSNGWNLFSFARILVIAGVILVIASILELIVNLGINMMGTKGETIGRLILSLVKYASWIIFAYLTLLNLGFNPTTLLASLGLISFAVSLGAQELIKDILAGLSTVFEGEYQVGDIIEVGGFRGKVLEIGVRTTKLEGRGGNILIVANSDVSNIVNMTRKNSWYPLELRFASDETFDSVEELLKKELPGIGDRIPEIINGPFYKGITGLSGDVLTVSIIAECNEEDYHEGERSLNREIRHMLDKNGIKFF